MNAEVIGHGEKFIADTYTRVPTGGSSAGNGLPSGYEAEFLNIVTDVGIVRRKVPVETASKANVVTWGAGEYRRLLQVNDEGVLALDYGYFAGGA